MDDNAFITRIVLGSSFTCDTVTEYIQWWMTKFGVRCECSILQYDQVVQSLIHQDSLFYGEQNYNVIMQRFEDFIHTENAAAQMISNINELYLQYKELLQNYVGRAKLVIAMIPVSNQAKKFGLEVYHFLVQISNDFHEFVKKNDKFEVIDFGKAEDDYFVTGMYDSVANQLGAVPYTEEFFAAAGTMIARKVLSMILPMHKVIVVDCDNTLWAGECGNGTAEINLYYLSFQRYLLEKKKKGYLLAICSKNYEADVIDFFSNHQMLLKLEDFVSIKINWNAKSVNINEIAKELNLGLNSFVFIDDSRYECLEVIENSPEILAIKFPEQSEQIPHFIKHIWALDQSNITKEDMNRTQMYQEEAYRKKLLDEKITFDTFVTKLGLEVYFNQITPNEYERAVQLIHRTNQFNISTKRRSYEELVQYLNQENTEGYVIRCVDKYGDYGIVGVILLEKKSNDILVDTLLLSCRVLGRKVELAITSFLLLKYMQEQPYRLIAEYIENERNQVASLFFEQTYWSTYQKEEKSTYYILKTEQELNTLLKEKLTGVQVHIGLKYETKKENQQTNTIAFHHIGIAVDNIVEVKKQYTMMGFACSDCITDSLQKADLCMCSLEEYANIELVEPLDESSALANIVKQYHQIPYHLCYSVSNIQCFLETLQQQGIEYDVVSDKKNAILFQYHPVEFVYIKDVGLIELLEDSQTSNRKQANEINNQIELSVQDISSAMKFFLCIGYEIEVRKEEEQKEIVQLYQYSYPTIQLMEEKASTQLPSMEYSYHIAYIGFMNCDNLNENLFELFPYHKRIELKRKKAEVSDWNVVITPDMSKKNSAYQNALQCHTGRALMKTMLIERLGVEQSDDGTKDNIEEGICDIIGNVLKVRNVSLKDNYIQLGGDSLKAVTILSRIRRKYHLAGTLEDFFDNPTIEVFIQRVAAKHSELMWNGIKKVDKSKHYPASESQKRIYVFQNMDPTSIVYNMPRVMYIHGTYDIDRICWAFQQIYCRHDSLRTNYEVINGCLYQFLRDEEELQVNVVELEQSEESIVRNFIQPFHLESDPLLRVMIVHRKNAEDLLLFDVHHIAVDGISLGIIVEEFIKLYNGEKLQTVEYQYMDYSVYEMEWSKEVIFKKNYDYWFQEFSDGFPQIELPLDHKRNRIQSFEGVKKLFTLQKENCLWLKQLAVSCGISLNTVLFSFYGLLISKYVGENQIVIGMPVSTRKMSETERIVGLMINMIPIRVCINYEDRIDEFLQKTSKTLLNAYDHPYFPYEEFERAGKVVGDSSRNPFFNLTYVMQNMDSKNFVMANLDFGEIRTSDFQLSLVPFEHQVSKYDVSFEVMEHEDNIYISIEYCTKLYDESTIQQLFDNYELLISQVMHQQERRLKDITMIDSQSLERAFLIGESMEHSSKTVLEAFHNIVRAVPYKIAIRDTICCYNYNELDEKSDHIAAELIRRNIKHGDLIAFYIQRTANIGALILGIMKAGAAYLPLSLEYPMSRIQHIVSDSKSVCLITDQKLEVTMEAPVWNLMELDCDKQQEIELPSVTENDLVYVIYTSGTTGRPKGVLIEQKNIMNYSLWRIHQYSLSEKDRSLSLLPACFDGFCSNFYSTLLSGGELVIANDQEWRDFNCIGKMIRCYGITNISLLPTMYRGILENNDSLAIESLRFIVLAGEKTEKDLILLSKQKNPKIRLINEYGATENTVTTSANLSMNELNYETIGTPIANNEICILDQYGHVLPFGMNGELCVCGKSLSRGYLNDETLSKEKFAGLTEYNICRLYRTGDHARITATKSIFFLGRKDHQLKLRGYRIELGEIEEVLHEYPGVRQVFIHVIEREYDQESKKQKYLCAYLVCDTGFVREKLLPYLQEQLPEYMVPTYYSLVNVIPMKQNGKIDVKALEEYPIHPLAESEFVLPDSDVEAQLCEICKRILKLERLSMNSNFLSMGGQSLDVATLQREIFINFHVELSMGELFKNPIIRSISDKIVKNRNKNYVSIKKANLQAYYPMSSAEKRIFLLEQIEEMGLSYHIPVFWKAEHIDLARLQTALNEMVEQNEVLRTVFEFQQEEPVQIIKEPYEVVIEQIFQEENNFCYEKWAQKYQLDCLPLFRVAYINEKILLFEFHHILIDGVALGIFFQELEQRYNGGQIPVRELQYKDYAVHCKNTDIYSAEAKQYWLNVFKKKVPTGYYRTDLVRKIVLGHSGNCITRKSGKTQYRQVKQLAKQLETTEFVILFAVYNCLLSIISNQTDIVVGIPTAGRNHPQVKEMMGIFVNTLAIRTDVNMSMTWKDFVHKVSEQLNDAYNNEDYPFEELVQELALEKVLNHKQLFDVMFVMRNVGSIQLNLGGYDCKRIEYTPKVSKYDFTLTVSENEEYLFDFQYNTELFYEETIQEFFDLYQTILEQVINHSDLKLCDLELLSTEKAHQLEKFTKGQIQSYSNSSFLEMFYENARKNSHRRAIVFEQESITYQEVIERMEHFAEGLIGKGVYPGAVIALITYPCIDMVVAMLAVMRCGASYVPIDPATPQDKKDYCIQDSSAHVILVQERSLYSSQSVNVVEFGELLEETPGKLGSLPEAKQTAYIIYTSGTTGKPKGVAVCHANLMNYICWFSRVAHLTYETKSLLVSSYSFDLGYTVIYPTLLQAGELHLMKKEEYIDRNNLLSYIRENQIHYLKMTPTMFHLTFFDENEVILEYNQLKRIVLGGESLVEQDVQRFMECYPHIQLMNHYGPTETTIGIVYRELSSSHPVMQHANPILGKPIDNTQVYLLNASLKQVPIGVEGEIYVSGAGVSQGYIGNDLLTNEKFVVNPFSNSHSIMYRTGDYGYLLHTGELVFTGRKDGQIKINGYRVELQEIKNQCLNIEGITAVEIVLLDEDSDSKSLIAYYVSAQPMDEIQIRKYLRQNLNEYMIPRRFIWLKQLPMNMNGKVDYSKLPVVNLQESNDFKELNLSPMENKVYCIWKELLGTKNFGIRDNFFDVGGNSILLLKLQKRLNEVFDVKIRTVELFQNTSVQQIAELLEETGHSDSIKMKGVRLPKEYYLKNDQVNLQDVLRLQLSKELTSKMSQIAKQINVEMDSIYIASFYYVWNQILETNDTSILWSDCLDSYCKIQIDLDYITDFKHLIYNIEQTRKDAKLYSKVIFESTPEENITYFLFGKNLVTKNLPKEFRMSFSLEQLVQKEHVICLYYDNCAFSEQKMCEILHSIQSVLDYICDTIMS